MPKCQSTAEAVSFIEPGQRVFVHGGVATPLALLDALVAQSGRLHDVELIHLHTSGDGAWAARRHASAFSVANLFVGPNMRARLDGDRVDYLPCFLSEMPALFRSRRRPIDVALLHVSPPDRHGYCTLGTSVDVARAAFEVATTVIAQVNPRMPRVHGDGIIPLKAIHHWVEVDAPIPEVPPRPPSEAERAIGRHCARIIDDGATLQMGIGAVPDAVLAALGDHEHLGIHTEMWSDGVLPLVEKGIVDNSKKAIHPGRLISGFCMGTRKLYDFIDDNPDVMQLDIAYVNDARVIARNPKVTAINSAVEVDLTGQVCADSIGHRIISGVARRQADHRAHQPHREGHAAHRAHAQRRRRRGDHARPRALGGDRVRHRRPLRPDPGRAGEIAHRHRSSRRSRGAGEGLARHAPGAAGIVGARRA
jgi:acyl-CoA hydrolase